MFLSLYSCSLSSDIYYGVHHEGNNFLLVFQIHLFGTSLGGFLAQLFAQHRPRRVKSLVLSNTFLETSNFSAAMPWAPMYVIDASLMSFSKQAESNINFWLSISYNVLPQSIIIVPTYLFGLSTKIVTTYFWTYTPPNIFLFTLIIHQYLLKKQPMAYKFHSLFLILNLITSFIYKRPKHGGSHTPQGKHPTPFCVKTRAGAPNHSFWKDIPM